jgi:ribosomal-protein-alanine N-acetyltransferase
VDGIIATDRMDLVPLPPALLRLIEGGRTAELERALGTRVPPGWADGIPASLRLEQLAADPSEEPWLVRAMVLRTPRRLVGSVGFHQPPDASGRAEIGYDVVAAQRRKGYAREGIHGMTTWAFATGRARICVASISPDNAASLALVRSLGFRQVGEQIDEVDGLELVFERRLPLDGPP